MYITDLIPGDELVNNTLKANPDICRCTSDYRDADSKSLLFLLPGVNYDTYKMIPRLLKKSVRAIVTEDSKRFPKTKTPIIEVKDARRAFAYAMSAISKIDYSKIKFIGVTGTNGKTSTASMIKSILEYNGHKCGFIGTGKILCGADNIAQKYYSMTCPDPNVLYPSIKKMQDAGCEYIVMEVSSHALALKKVDPIPFEIGIFTGLSHEHLEFHKNMENYFAAKEILIKKSKQAIINYDDKYGKILYEKYEEKSTSVGIIWRSCVFATDIESSELCKTQYIYRSKNFLTRITLSLPGIYNVYNSMMAFCCTYKCNLMPKDIKNALSSVKAIEGRFECIRDNVTVIIDYAHTPRALENVFKTLLSTKNTEQNVWIVFGCGGERDAEKRPMMARVCEKYADRIIVTNDNPRSESEDKIIMDILGGFEKKSYAVITDRALAITYAIKSAADNDYVIIAGKGHEKYVLDKSGYHDFDERAVIKEALKLRNSEV